MMPSVATMMWLFCVCRVRCRAWWPCAPPTTGWTRCSNRCRSVRCAICRPSRCANNSIRCNPGTCNDVFGTRTPASGGSSLGSGTIVDASGIIVTNHHVIKDATDASFAADVIEASREQPVIVDFWATWCGPCRMMAPVMEAADAELGSAIHFTKIDVDELPDIAADFDIMSIPTIVILENFAHTLQQVRASVPVEKVVLTSLGELLGFPKAAIVDFVVRRVKKLAERALGAISGELNALYSTTGRPSIAPERHSGHSAPGAGLLDDEGHLIGIVSRQDIVKMLL